MSQRSPRRRRARPVADAPIDALLARADDLAKGWLLELLEETPLDQAPAILAGDLAREGPRLCAGAVRALADDAELRRLGPGGALEPLAARTWEIAAAPDVEATAAAVDALAAVLWSAVRGELADPDVELVAALAERLAMVMDLVRGAALRGLPPTGPLRPPTAAPVRPPTAAPVPARLRPATETGDRRWQDALADEIARAERSGTALSLLLVELEDADRVLSVASAAEAGATFGRFSETVRGVVRRQDILACETEARAWVIARDTGRLEAHSLGSRLAAAVREAPDWRGAPLTVSVGFAVLGDPARGLGELIAAAEEACFAAAASGERVTPAAGSQGRDDGAGEPGRGGAG
jgi:GGDEF domain-containing protein